MPREKRPRENNEVKLLPANSFRYLQLNTKPRVDSHEFSDDLVIGSDGKGAVVSINTDHDSQELDLKALEAGALPIHFI